MVTRQYRCKTCGVIELMQCIHQNPYKVCPYCGEKIEQIFTSIPAVIWKGRFRWMRSEPEVDMEKIEAQQDAEALKQARGKLRKGLDESTKKYY